MAIFQVNLSQPVPECLYSGFIGAMHDGGGGNNWSCIRRAKLQLDHHHQQTNTQFLYRPDALPVAQPSVTALKEKQGDT